jgi:hypothetical protein
MGIRGLQVNGQETLPVIASLFPASNRITDPRKFSPE